MQALAVELFKIKNAMPHEIVPEILLFRTGNHHNLRQESDFLFPSIRTVYQGSVCLPDLGPINWNNIDTELK